MADYKFNISSNEYLPLRDVVFNTLRDAILTGKLEPGERLMENQLAEKLGVSRTPIHETLRMLEIENLVELTPRKGAQVLEMSKKDVIDILEVREVLEGLGTQLACQKMTPEALQELKKTQLELEKATQEGNVEKMANSDEHFHDIIFLSTENEKLIQIFNNLRIQLYRYRMAHVKLESGMKNIIAQHHRLLEAIEEKDAKAGEALAKEHIQYHAKFILDVLQKKE